MPVTRANFTISEVLSDDESHFLRLQAGDDYVCAYTSGWLSRKVTVLRDKSDPAFVYLVAHDPGASAPYIAELLDLENYEVVLQVGGQ